MRTIFTSWTLILFICLSSCASSPGPPSVPTKEAELARLLSSLTLRQRIGQRIIGWVPRDGLTDEIEELVVSGEIGGFILYPWNYEDISDVQDLTSRLRHLEAERSPEIPLFITADQEGGRVAAFRFDEFIQLPSAYNLGNRNSEDLVRAAAYVNALQLQSIGINMNLAPVLDLYPEPDRTIIGDRSFGDDEEQTARYGYAFMAGTIDAGVVPVLKHFPGHGLSSVDSHGNLPVIQSLESGELRRHLMPFIEAIQAGAPAIMTAHLLFPEIDDTYPVTLSKKFISDLLRNELGFDGLIMTDGLAMGALAKKYSLDDTITRCFEVGIDMLLIHSRYDVSGLIDRIEAMVISGAITTGQIDEGLLRVLITKQNAGLLSLNGQLP
ncbi:MAG: beta-N-acetylhexosaminidase [Spirochaetales bacterium]|jgi:beta-N-acetylhexosaminidase|nr:beta-N-acetylhexosaminidase [Spirochaetales bacterium]